MSGEVILIADDDSADVYFLRQALKERFPDCAFFDVGDGEEAIDYLAGRGKYADRQAYPLPTQVFLDIKMPKRSGFEVLSWLRAQEGMGRLQVTVISGSSLPNDENKARSMGADFYVKPIDYEGLQRIILDYCRRHGYGR